MILITSAAYVTPGLISEFGKLPPSMLPLQNRRLYRHQAALFESLKEEVYLSLPEDYRLDEFDQQQLKELNVTVVYAPNGLSLGASIVYVLNVIGRFAEPVRILHGDTLFRAIYSSLDVCSIYKTADDYQWTAVDGKGSSKVYTGYFSFSSQSGIIRCITENHYDFMDGVAAYKVRYGLDLEEMDGWMDFGIVNSYYRSKSMMTTQRVFNDLKIDKYSVTKYSKDANKILAEAHWMSSLPSELKHFVPTVWNSGMKEDKGFYEIEYFYLSSLADLFVFGNSPLFVWKGILDSCADFLNQTGRYQPEHLEEVAKQSVTLYRSKTQGRLAEYAKTQGISMNREWTINGIHTPSLNEILEEVSIPLDQSQPQFMRIMHGDFCFSNILYDFKSLSIKVLDPRGRDLEGNYSIYGDLRYDVAKLAHSVIGLYDFIIGGLFECRFDRTAYSMELKFPQRSNLEGLQNYFNELHFAGYTVQELSVYPILVHLFLSMLPLHGDHPARQEAMLANALRLYTIYKQQQNQ